MHLEQVVLFGPSDTFTIRFGPRLTVLAGLEDRERAELVDTLVSAMAGQLPNASVVYVDHAGRRVFADRTGAIYAEGGGPAPSLADLVGTDREVISGMVVLRPDDLGLGPRQDPAELEAALTAARATLEQARAAAHDARTTLQRLDDDEERLTELDRLIASAADHAERWAWMQRREELDRRRGDLAAAALAASGATDDGDDTRRALLAEVDELRRAGEAWAEASAEATERSMALGPLPAVSDADLARVAATPDEVPGDLDALLATVSEAIARRIACADALAESTAPPADPLDGIVVRLAALDQELLWSTHRAALDAQAAYEAALAHTPEGDDDATVARIEETHLEVVRCQREADRGLRIGVGATSLLATIALLLGQTISVPVGVLVLALAVLAGFRLLVQPRRELAFARAEEDRALADGDAQSWLGLHLRRIDQVMAKGDRGSLAGLVDQRARTLLDWDELTDTTSLEAAATRREAIEAYASATDPASRAARTRDAAAAVDRSTAEEARARRALVDALDGFGLDPFAEEPVDPEAVRATVAQRATAGRFARRVLDLHRSLVAAEDAGAELDRVLRRLGFDDGDLPSRLERAIVAVEAARSHEDGTGADAVARLIDEVEQLTREVDAGRRVTWDLTDDPTEPPVPTEQLEAERRELATTLARSFRPDPTDLDRRVDVASERVAALEHELAAVETGPTSVRRRFADRLARTSWVGVQEETLPLLIDDAFAEVAPDELFKLLDMAARLSDRAQLVLLSSDPTVARWARREAGHGSVTLFEADGVLRS